MIAHAASAGGGAITVSWFAKTLLKAWMKKHDDVVKEVRELKESVQELAIEVAKTGVIMRHFDAMDRKMQDLDKQAAVIDHRLSETEADLNGLGHKIRTLETS